MKTMETDVLRDALASPPTPDELEPLPDEESRRLRRDNEALRADKARLQAEVLELRRELQAAEEAFAQRLTQLLNESLLRLREAAAPACPAPDGPGPSDARCADGASDVTATADVESDVHAPLPA
jgi:hypothetical protein